MAKVNNPELTVPIRGIHVRNALATAKQDRAGFRKAELEWLDHNFPLFKTQVVGIAGKEDKTKGKELTAGMLLGNHAARLCTGDTGYEKARVNFRRNADSDEVVIAPWNQAETLREIYGTYDMVSALLNVRPQNSRSAAAVSIAYLCFSEVPVLEPAAS